ncbi:hypothetical protein BELL_0029g00380 [Botrytis elliptica]|uniref:Amidohydrolase-related domain-containing protein n=1 Tax=Botrytis elliptica TaxID=278938 RepID=A0A4Z1K7P4_9HELO|nr:hypothetical protein EAE99_010465 [Botrytis elliptica]TGO79572.1 hypothetical protein BELL_0029g00380 [Botrytis elliptica]
MSFVRTFGKAALATLLLTPSSISAADYTPQETVLNSGRPTFYDASTSIPGKIALEEHVGNDLLNGLYTVPYYPNTNEPQYSDSVYIADVGEKMLDIPSRIANMDAANISISVLTFGGPGIQGVFNATYATYAAGYVNDYLYKNYKNNANYTGRFEFWCSNALQEPANAATELERCVKELGGVGSFVGGYTNNGGINGTANDIVYLDDPSMEPFLEKVVELDVPIYLHPRMPAPSQLLSVKGYEFLGSSPWGFSSETGAHALRLMVSGTLDKYPTLKIVLGHCGEGLPFFLPRIDQRLRHFNKDLFNSTLTMEEYWLRNFWVTTAGVQDAGTVVDTIKRTGEDRVMFSVDYPFEDTVEIAGWFDRLEMNTLTKTKLAYENAKALLKLT